MYTKHLRMKFTCLIFSIGFSLPALTASDLGAPLVSPVSHLLFKSLQYDGLSETHDQDLYKGNVKLFKLYKNGSTYGQTVWLYRKSGNVKAKYFAHRDYDSNKSVYDRYREWKGDGEIIMVCAGAFTSQDYTKPVGLTVDNGKVVNRKIDESMDGLVIVYATGGIVVSDIDEGNLYLQSLGRQIDARDPRDKYELLDWAEKEEATIFQTQLLCYKNQLRISSDGRKERATRRLLILGTDGKGEVVHVVFNVQRDVYLYDISKEVLEYLKKQGLNVIAMLNLDTGMYNILEVYNERGYQIDEVEGEEPVQKATNLLSYYYDTTK